MREHCHILVCFVVLLITSSIGPVFGQLGFDLKIDKPKPYEERVLRAEKATDKPLKGPGKFFQNLTTHYNYYFNASTKLNEVIDQAKLSFRDDYTLLLPFYNYSLETTSQSIVELDSVIYKAQTAIVLHDLRNDWVDNMYLLWGAAYFFEKKFDSAALMFQFINHSFAEKEKDGYYRYIGSRMDGNNALSVSTKEDAKFPKNTVTPPSRNNSLIWRIRSLIELGNMAEVGSLISTLKYDPLFPERLKDDLEEVQAYWFYKQNIWDSSANHLLKALSQAKNKQEKARWEYLAAQMMERSGKFEEAQKLYEKSISHTTDPVMEVYARLNMVRINKDTTDNYIDRNIAELVKMARRDKYVDYRDIIYYMAAQMELERNNPIAAQDLLLKSAKYNNGNLGSRNKSFLLIADLSYNQKKYEQAAAFYDSVQVADIEDPLELSKVEERKTILSKIISFSKTISKEDSLQRLAAMPEEERT
ncbi:MAG: tetratricopeptide repeat protein, partial [Flavitalea sp.]